MHKNPDTSPDSSPDSSQKSHAPEDGGYEDGGYEDGGYDAAEDRRRIAELGDEIAELSAHIDAATQRLLRAIHEFDQRQG